MTTNRHAPFSPIGATFDGWGTAVARTARSFFATLGREEASAWEVATYWDSVAFIAERDLDEWRTGAFAIVHINTDATLLLDIWDPAGRRYAFRGDDGASLAEAYLDTSGLRPAKGNRLGQMSRGIVDPVSAAAGGAAQEPS